jgi:hypothetical protein
MKGDEIMVGDWVYDTMRQENKKVTRMDFERNPMNGVYYAETLKPIPLTEYILAKNGFRYSMSHDDWTNINCNFFLHEGGNGYRVQNTDIKLDYVHQLQHLLRLCGVEKELTI